jgi:hypothetical protein
MPEEKKLTFLQEQKLVKPTPEDVIPDFFDGDIKKNALDFVTWLRENNLPPRWAGIYTWKVYYKSQYICYINFSYPAKGSWMVKPNRLFFGEYGKYIIDDEMKKFVLNIVQLPGCNRLCGRKKDIEFLGKKFEEICSCWPFYIKNPDGAALENLKKLVLISKDIIGDLIAAGKK